jgi:UDP-N-acetylglucosamine diphosphorylase/glucosamine-1-phosphate N-acetyltransferase
VSLSVVLFEDHRSLDFYPLTLSRPPFLLRSGCLLALDRAERRSGVTVSYLTRNACAGNLRRACPSSAINVPPEGESLFLNGRLFLGPGPDRALREIPGGEAVFAEGLLLAARVPARTAGALFGLLRAALGEEAAERPAGRRGMRLVRRGEVVAEDPEAIVDRTRALGIRVREAALPGPSRIWRLVHENAETIARDLAEFPPASASRFEGPAGGVSIAGPAASILLGEDVRLSPGVVLDASRGPILLERGVTVEPLAVLAGPLVVGAGSLVRSGARIYPGTSIGPKSKVGGEIEDAIVLGHSNKQHDGFLGHAYVGEWVNLGAGTTVSDLKNNYGAVRVQVDDREEETGERFVGLFAADHVKTGIQSMLNTGTVIGFAANVFGAGFPPKHVPSFAWGGAGGFGTHDLERAVETATVVMARRGVAFDEGDRLLFETLFRTRAGERAGWKE